MAVNEKVQVDIVFNPDTKQLEKRTMEVLDKSKLKIKFDKPDVKELEGPLKDFQEKAMALANGGIGKGFSQLREGIEKFNEVSKGGGDFATALAGGFSKIGMEASVVTEVLIAATTATAAAIIGFVALADKGLELSVGFKSLGVDAQEYSSALNGAINFSEALSIKNAALSVGFNLNARQLATVANYTAVAAQRNGDLQGTQSLVTQALQGNKEAMYQLGITYNDTDTVMQRVARTIEFLNQKSEQLGPKQQGFFEQVSLGFGRMANVAATAVGNFVDGMAWAFRSNAENIARDANARLEQLDRDAKTRRDQQDSENRDRIQKISDYQQERNNALAADSIRAAREGESTRQQILRSEMESLNINMQLQQLRRIEGGSDEAKANRAKLIADLQRQEAAQVQRRNQLNSFAVQLADAQRARLVQMAVAQANHTGQNIKQLSLAEQIAMAERKRAEIVAAIMAAGGVVTDNQQRELENLQNFINQNKVRTSQTASQDESIRRQNNQLELQMRYENELARARGESYRTDIDSIDVAQRKTQIESALNGLHAYRGRTVQQEAARLAEIQRRTEELTRLREIENAQLERRRNLQQTPRGPEGAIAEGAANSARNLSSLIDLQRQQNEASYQFALKAQDAQRAGLPLTNSQVESLTRLSQIEEQRRVYQTVDQQRLSQITQELQKENLTTERRIELLRQEAELRQRISGIEQDNLNRQQRSSFAGNKALETMESLAGGYRTVEDAAQGLASQGLQQLSSAFGSVISSAIEGKQSFGDAMQEMTKSLLGALAQQAAVQALFQTATGFGKLALNDIPGATSAFTSAAMFAAVGAIAGGISAAIPSTQSSQSSSRGVSTPSQSSSESNSNKSGSMIININMKGALQTDKELQKAVAYSLYEYESRMGKRR